LNGGPDQFAVDPATVGAVSKLALDLTIDGWITETFEVGGCVEIGFQAPAAYDTLTQRGDPYNVFPGAVGSTLDCTGLTPANTVCELVTNSRVKLTLATAGTAIQGAIPGLQNPFSTQTLKINSISYKSPAGGGCAKTTADLTNG